MYGIVDCNNFYASCERVFRPGLAGRPVVVLSNNDGCVIARSAEAKALGIAMGAPAFKWRGVFRRHRVAVFSSNYALYGDLSGRVMASLARLFPRVEVYSIDEAFVRLPGSGSMEAEAREAARLVRRWTGIPVSVGLGPSKTLAKAANRHAKKHPECGGVFLLEPGPEADAVLEGMAAGDVWGIGPRYARMLARHGVATARAFRDLDPDWVKRRMTVGGLATLLELRGRAVLPMERAPAPKKAIAVSRSFGRPVRELREMREAVAAYASRAGEKLRRQGSTASGVLAFVQTSRFRENQPLYAASAQEMLPAPTPATPDLIRAAHRALERVFKPGLDYKKAGVMLFGLENADARQLTFFDPNPEAERKTRELMRAVDAANTRFGSGTLGFAAAGTRQPWAMRQALRSPGYTTRWSDLPVVKAENQDRQESF